MCLFLTLSLFFFLMYIPITFITVKECNVHEVGQDYSSLILYLTL